MAAVLGIAKNSSLVLIARSSDVVSGILVAAILARYLGVEDYGNYLFIMGLALTVTAFAHLGLPQILVREMSQKRDSVAKFIKCGLFITGGSFLLTTLIVFSIGLFSGWNFLMFMAVFTALLSEAMVLLSGPFMSAFVSFNKMQYDAIVTVIARVIVIASLICVVSWDLGFLAVFCTMALANIIRLSIIVYIASRNRIRLNCIVKKDDVKYLVVETLPLGISYIFTQLFLYTNVFMLKMLRDPEQLALFQAPFSIVLKLNILPTILAVAFAPVLARLAVNDLSFEVLRNVYMCIIKYLFIICLPLALIGVYLAKDIVVFVFGIDFTNAAVSFQISIWVIGFYFLNIFSDNILQFIWKQHLLTISSGITFVSNVVLSFLFVYKYGYVGASISVLLSTAIHFALNFYFVSTHLKGVTVTFMLKPIFAFSAAVVIAYGVFPAKPAIMILLALLVYIFALYVLKVFSKAEFRLFEQALDERARQH